MTDAPRLPPLPRERWDADAIAALRAVYPERVVDRFLATGPDARRVPNVLATLLHHPALTGPWLAYNNVLLFQPTIETRLRELLVLRVAARTHSDYEWAQHARIAERSGISAAEVDAVAQGRDIGTWSPVEAAALAAVDQLVDHFGIDDDTWARLAEHLDERALVEVVFVIGTYACLAMAFNSFGLQLDPDLVEPEPEERAPEDRGSA